MLLQGPTCEEVITELGITSPACMLRVLRQLSRPSIHALRQKQAGTAAKQAKSSCMPGRCNVRLGAPAGVCSP